jgi:hypothetical protein
VAQHMHRASVEPLDDAGDVSGEVVKCQTGTDSSSSKS